MSFLKLALATSIVFAGLTATAPSASAAECHKVGIIECTGSLLGNGPISCKQVGTKTVCTSDKSVVEFGDPELSATRATGPKNAPLAPKVFAKTPAAIAR